MGDQVLTETAVRQLYAIRRLYNNDDWQFNENTLPLIRSFFPEITYVALVEQTRAPNGVQAVHSHGTLQGKLSTAKTAISHNVPISEQDSSKLHTAAVPIKRYNPHTGTNNVFTALYAENAAPGEISESLLDIGQEIESVYALYDDAFIDKLTGFRTKSFENTLERAVEQSRQTGEPLSLLFFDYNNLKIVNDTIGHSEGNIYLRNVAREILKNTRRTDKVYRWGGDEGAIILPGTHAKQAERVKQVIYTVTREIGKEMKAQVDNNKFIDTPIAIGVVEYNPHIYQDKESFQRAAEYCMKEEKARLKQSF